MPAHLQDPLDPLHPVSPGELHFHKSLPHHANGLVQDPPWTAFLTECLNTIATPPTPGGAGFDTIGDGLTGPPPPPPAQAMFLPGLAPTNAPKFVGPLAGWAMGDCLWPNPDDLKMPPPPSVTSKAIAAELNELYWMAALRDVPFDKLGATAAQIGAISDINHGYDAALSGGEPEMQTFNDVPTVGPNCVFDGKTLFGAALPGTQYGPLVSQFFLHDIGYGAQQIIPWQVPYRAGVDYLTDVPTWLLAQNTGYDIDGDAYSQDNDYKKDMKHFEAALPDGRLPRYYIRNMRDLCRFVNRDALHQAYFNAALLLNNWNAKTTPGNPVGNNVPQMPPPAPMNVSGQRQGGFATLGGPEILALVGTVAAYALRAVWRQKWHVWLRLRPEAYAGLVELAPGKLGAGLAALQGLGGYRTNHDQYGTALLPIAFSAGSPAHPTYGAGHASVAGACVTLLKAWFDGSKSINDTLANAFTIDPGTPPTIKQAADHPAFGQLPDYAGSDAALMTVEGELNKLASNVALGRSMGGVHFRSDNTRSLRLGELVATVFLANWVQKYAEKPRFKFNSFDKQPVVIHPNGTVSIGGAPGVNVATVIAGYHANGHI